MLNNKNASAFSPVINASIYKMFCGSQRFFGYLSEMKIHLIKDKRYRSDLCYPPTSFILFKTQDLSSVINSNSKNHKFKILTTKLITNKKV